MYSKQQASQLRQEFWTAFGKYMQPILSEDGEKVNWINYKTGVKHISFRMHAAKGASIGIEITHPDPEQRAVVYNRFLQLRQLFCDMAGNDWNWEAGGSDEHGKPMSCIYTRLDGVHLFNRDDWPALISFFKPRLLALDRFWSLARDGFID
jgi:hypothetical protein